MVAMANLLLGSQSFPYKPNFSDQKSPLEKANKALGNAMYHIPPLVLFYALSAKTVDTESEFVTSLVPPSAREEGFLARLEECLPGG